MATRTPSPASRSVTCDRRCVRPGHDVTEIGEQFGDAAHPDAANPDEMHPPRLPEHRPLTPGPQGPSLGRRSTPTRDRRSPSRRRAAPARALPRPSAPAPRCRASAGQSVAPAPAPVASDCSSISAAPADASVSALRRWWSSVAVGSGIRIAGFPAAVISASVVAPARQTIRSADRETPSHVEEERLDFGLKPRLPVTGAHHLHISLARLVRETNMRDRRPPAAALPPPWPD